MICVTQLRYRNDGIFKLLDFQITHSRLLLRHSYLHAGHTVNIDLVFTGVRYYELPVVLHGIFIENGDVKDIVYILGRLTAEETDRAFIGTETQVFKILSEGRNFYIAAHGVDIHFNSVDPDTSPFPPYFTREQGLKQLREQQRRHRRAQKKKEEKFKMLLESTKAAITKYCQYQERCHSEAKSKLMEIGCTNDEAEEYIAWLIGEGILNEERFARSFARGKFRMLGWGKDKIKQHLKLKKVSDYCIRKAFTEIDDAEYGEKLQKFAEKKAKELKSEKNQPTKKRKIYNFLIQKGYERDLVIYLLNNMFSKESS